MGDGAVTRTAETVVTAPVEETIVAPLAADENLADADGIAPLDFDMGSADSSTEKEAG